MHSMQPNRGRAIRNHELPNWEPLAKLAPEYADDFMWMFEVELENGLTLYAYKHWETRRYLYLDQEGHAFVHVWNEDLTADDDGHYEEVDPQWLLTLVLDQERSASLVRRDVLSEFKFERIR